MDEIPSMWREEVWHALSVHLPLVTLLLASITSILFWFFRENTKDFLRRLTLVMLFLGVTGGWIAIYTGEVAYNIEVRKICDPKVLQRHQWWAYAMLITYSVSLALLIMGRISQNYQKKLHLVCTFLTTIALGGLLYSGHLGASLVYQQGAGTYQPSEKCVEFEK